MFCVGSTFSSFPHSRRAFTTFEDNTHSEFYTRDARTLKAAARITPKKAEKANTDLKYYYIKYTWKEINILTPLQPGCTNTSYIFDCVYEIVCGHGWMDSMGRYLPMEAERAVNVVSEDVSSSFNLAVDSGKLEIIDLQTTAT